MVITVRGPLKSGDTDGLIVWDDGDLSGPSSIDIEHEASSMFLEFIGPAPGYWSRDRHGHIRHPRSFLVLVDRVFSPGYSVRFIGGALPEEPRYSKEEGPVAH